MPYDNEGTPTSTYAADTYRHCGNYDASLSPRSSDVGRADGFVKAIASILPIPG